MNPTSDTYTSLTKAYEFFNKELFNSKLPNCLITMQRKGKAAGFFCPERFETRDEASSYAHEIALNPTHFKGKSDAEILSTLLHEMVHLWQQENGTAPRRGYHNKEWANKMEACGLVPSNTGEPDGKKTGQSMSDYIKNGGRFENLAISFLAKNKGVFYQDRPQIKRTVTRKSKVKYSCQTCGLNAWGKPELNILCGIDKLKMAEHKV